MTAAETKFRAEQNASAKDKFHADIAAMASGQTVQAKPALADPSRFAEAQYGQRVWLYTMRAGETIDEVKREGFLKNLSGKINLGDEIKVRSADLTYHALLVVIASDHVAARVELRTQWEAKHEPADRKEYDADGYTIEDTGDVLRRLAVMRKADGKLMRDGFATRQDAQHYISTELMARAA